ncbi:MAG: glycerol kinase GlpK [Candidatus Heimdallarchaeota archaeon]|nr:glycerol kinase GlpK [Candidatus Heimdallarchaeota archaeon]MCK4611518.1 glycerol kinase GlpK [Candidatus Heimdallarchaeota archaeon]
MMKFVLSIDQGTTGTRAMVFNKHGEELAKDYVEHEQFYPKPGWVEHHPSEIWEKTKIVMRNALDKAKITSESICSIGITNQRETVVAWNTSTGLPLHKAIVWQCRRTADTCSQLKEEGFSALFTNTTGLVLDPYFSGTKIKWLLDNSSKVQDALKFGNLAVGTIDSWLIWNLTGKNLTDYSNASRTLLFDIHKGLWSEEILEVLDIPLHILPEVRPSSDKEIYGYSKDGLFESSIPITGVAGDQQAALFGQTCFKAGSIKNTYGTGNFMLLNTGSKPVKSDSGLLTTIAWKIDSDIQYALEGSVFITGAVIQWLEEGIGILENKSDLERIMNELTNTDGVFFVPAFVGLGAPHWDACARGMIIGLTRGTTRDHLIRAAMESICYQSEDIFELMKKDSGLSIDILRVDGGVTNNSQLLQFQSNISDVTIQKPVVNETTALGAAYLAGLAVDYWTSLDDISQNFQVEKEFHPNMNQDERSLLIQTWKKALERSMNWCEV